MNAKQYIKQHNITATSVQVPENPTAPDWKDANHYHVTLYRPSDQAKFTLYFSMGLGLKGKPTAASILECLALDFSMLENSRNFDDWAADLGFDSDSRKAEQTYKTVEKQMDLYFAAFGADAYKDLLKVEEA